jgi:hypothetical protein
MIRDDGNVGIGTSGTTARLQVVSSNNSNSTWTAQFHNNSGSNNALMIRDDGNVGIGTSTPTSNFDVVGTVEFQNPSASYDGGILGSELLTASGWTTTGWTGTYASGFTHTTGNTNVLSNTLAAVVNNYYQIAYAVSGRTAGSFTVSFGGQIISSLTSNGSFGPRATTTDSLSITPTSDFNGTIIISVKQITGGNSAFVAKSFDGNVVYQQRFSSINTNVFLGSNVGRLNTTGASNTVVGTNSLQNNTTGSFNLVFGQNTLASNTVGVHNTALGYAALFSSEVANFNTGVGSNTLYSNLTGNNNSAIGYQSMYFNTSGTNNTAIGFFSLRLNTTGLGNTAIGGDVLYSNTTGSANVAIGRESLYSNKTGSNNTVIGNRAGLFVASGITGNEKIDNYILIGYDARALASGQTNQVVIGYLGRGLGSNTTIIGNDSTTQTHLYGNLTLGSTAVTTATLNITGGGFTTGTTSMLILNSTGGTNVTVNDGGNVGIGTSEPNGILNAVKGVSDIRLSTGAAAITPTISVINTASNGKAAALLAGITYSAFEFDNAGYFAITSAVKSAFLNNINGNGTVRLVVKGDGLVGIGTVNPAQTLDVAGTMRLTGSTGTGTTLMARNADGDVSAVTLSGGLSLSNNVLSGASSITPKAETPTGLVNGSNLVYTITTTPIANEGVIVFLNGIAQYNGIDYTVSGTTITFTNAPASGSSIFVYYFA